MLMVSLNSVLIRKGTMDTTNNVIPFKHPKFPDYRCLSSRLNSYFEYDWPIGLGQTPKSLAKAGLFYLGKSDKVICYHCGGCLGRWDQEDIPWIEHARNFPTCVHVNIHKPPEFIKNTQGIFIKPNDNNLLHDNNDTTSKRIETKSSMENKLPNIIQITKKLKIEDFLKKKKKIITAN